MRKKKYVGKLKKSDFHKQISVTEFLFRDNDFFVSKNREHAPCSEEVEGEACGRG